MPGIKVRVDLSGIEKRFSKKAMDQSRYLMANQMLSDMNENFVPQRSGDLRMISGVSPDGSSLFWNSVYAGYQYWNQFSNYTTPGTGPRWDLKAKSVFMGDWVDVFKGGLGL